MKSVPQSLAVRVIAVLAGVFLVGFGIWAFLSPSTFYSSIALFPPYNQHFLHDVGAFQVGLGTALLLTELWDDALLAVLGGNAVGATIHLISHQLDRSLGGHPSTDIPFLGGLSVVLIGAWVLRYRQLRAARR
ncbi:MAG TPA: pyridoxamine 5'-phosphate oxidase [Candidatus Dormibacteraeota bacterium]|nr:pyridoxamine 5'-phosphate oxidase [Candidatus Dormibacteraeota bacterium]